VSDRKEQVVPEDIREAAENALDNLLCNCVESCGGADKLREASIHEIALAILAERERDQWQPIKDAPKDGTVVDLWHEETGREADMYWGKPQHSCGEYGRYCDSEWHSEPEGWVCGTINQVIFDGGYTHFMPLPTPPKGGEE
jgi:hypothetical protein